MRRAGHAECLKKTLHHVQIAHSLASDKPTLAQTLPTLQIEARWTCVKQLAAGLAYLHSSGIALGDVSLHNVQTYHQSCTEALPSLLSPEASSAGENLIFKWVLTPKAHSCSPSNRMDFAGDVQDFGVLAKEILLEEAEADELYGSMGTVKETLESVLTLLQQQLDTVAQSSNGPLTDDIMLQIFQCPHETWTATFRHANVCAELVQNIETGNLKDLHGKVHMYGFQPGIRLLAELWRDTNRAVPSLREALATAKGSGCDIYGDLHATLKMLEVGWLSEAWGAATHALSVFDAQAQDWERMAAHLRGTEFRGCESLSELARLLPLAAQAQRQQRAKPHTILRGIRDSMMEALAVQVPFWPLLLPPRAAQEAARVAGESYLLTQPSTSQAMVWHMASTLPMALAPHDAVNHLLCAWRSTPAMMGVHLVQPCGILLWAAAATVPVPASTDPEGLDQQSSQYAHLLGNQAVALFAQQKLAIFFQHTAEGGSGRWESHVIRTVGLRHGVASSLLSKGPAGRVLVLLHGNNVLECFALQGEEDMSRSATPQHSRPGSACAGASRPASPRGPAKLNKQQAVSSVAVSVETLLDKVIKRAVRGEGAVQTQKLIALEEGGGGQILLPIQHNVAEVWLLVMKLQPESSWGAGDTEGGALKAQAVHPLSLKAGISRFASLKVGTQERRLGDSLLHGQQMSLRPRLSTSNPAAELVMTQHSAVFFLQHIWEIVLCLESHLLWWRVPFPLETSTEGLALDESDAFPDGSTSADEAESGRLPVHFVCKLPFAASSWQLLSHRARLVALTSGVDPAQGYSIAILDAWYGDIVGLVSVPDEVSRLPSPQRGSMWLGLSGSSVVATSSNGRAATWSVRKLCDSSATMTGAKGNLHRAVKRISIMSQLSSSEAKPPHSPAQPELGPRILGSDSGREGWRALALPHSRLKASPDVVFDVPSKDCKECLILPAKSFWSTGRTLHAVFHKVRVKRQAGKDFPTFSSGGGGTSPLNRMRGAGGRASQTLTSPGASPTSSRRKVRSSSIASDVSLPPTAFRQVSATAQVQRKSPRPATLHMSSSISKVVGEGSPTAAELCLPPSCLAPPPVREDAPVWWREDASGTIEVGLPEPDYASWIVKDVLVLPSTYLVDVWVTVSDSLEELRHRLHGKRVPLQRLAAWAAALEACERMGRPFAHMLHHDLQELRLKLCANLQLPVVMGAPSGPSSTTMLFTSLGMASMASSQPAANRSKDLGVYAGVLDLEEVNLVQEGSSGEGIASVAMDASSHHLLIVHGDEDAEWTIEFWLLQDACWIRSAAAVAHSGCSQPPSAALSEHGVVGVTAADCICGWDGEDAELLFQLHWPGKEVARHCWCSADMSQLAVATSEGIMYWQDGELVQVLDTRAVILLAEQVNTEKGNPEPRAPGQTSLSERQVTSAHCSLAVELWALGAVVEYRWLAVLVKVRHRNAPTAYALMEPNSVPNLMSLWVSASGFLLLGPNEELQVWSVPWSSPGMVPKRRRATTINTARRGAAIGEAYFNGVALLAAVTEEAFLSLAGRTPDSVVPLRASMQWRSQVFALPACSHIINFCETSRLLFMYDEASSALFAFCLLQHPMMKAPLKPQWVTTFHERLTDASVQVRVSSNGFRVLLTEGWRWSMWNFKPRTCQVFFRAVDAEEADSDVASDVGSISGRRGSAARLRSDSLGLNRRRALSSLPVDFLRSIAAGLDGGAGGSTKPQMPATAGTCLRPSPWWLKAAALPAAEVKGKEPDTIGELMSADLSKRQESSAPRPHASPTPPLQWTRAERSHPPRRARTSMGNHCDLFVGSEEGQLRRGVTSARARPKTASDAPPPSPATARLRQAQSLKAKRGVSHLRISLQDADDIFAEDLRPKASSRMSIIHREEHRAQTTDTAPSRERGERSRALQKEPTWMAAVPSHLRGRFRGLRDCEAAIL